MRDQLIQYVNLLFAGAEGCEDIHQEILQNTLDRYDDLIAEGKVPEAAYRLAITGIGDINEILGTKPHSAPAYHHSVKNENAEQDTPKKKLLRAIAVGLYIICPMPLFLLSEMGSDTLGLCGTLAIVAVATMLIMLGAKKDGQEETTADYISDPKKELRKSIHNIIWAVGLAIYFLVSFATNAWYITWLIFPLTGAVQGLVKAILDLKEASQNEN